MLQASTRSCGLSRPRCTFCKTAKNVFSLAALIALPQSFNPGLCPTLTRDRCSNKTFNLWWEMYASRSVIEGTNLDANFRQAVNHFEFNDALVSKKVKGLACDLLFCGLAATTV